MVDHAATEAVLWDSGVAFTSLRNGFYAASALMLLGNALKTGELAAPDNGPVAWTAHADLAEATAITLSEEVLDGVTPSVTASEAIDLDSIAALASDPAQRSAGSLCRTLSIRLAWSPTASQTRALLCFWACSARADKVNSPGSTRRSPASSTGR